MVFAKNAKTILILKVMERPVVAIPVQIFRGLPSQESVNNVQVVSIQMIKLAKPAYKIPAQLQNIKMIMATVLSAGSIPTQIQLGALLILAKIPS